MTTERDKFLTEAMGECYLHTLANRDGVIMCSYCNHIIGYGIDLGEEWYKQTPINNFSTWEGFGKLWEWAREQSWWEDFYWGWMHYKAFGRPHYFMFELINPDNFANTLYKYKYLKGNQQ